jgi:galactose-1-phosphate uridylyltransferase
MRTKLMCLDFRRVPQTDRYCALCQRDLQAGQPAREVRWELDKYEAVHPDDWEEAEREVCARRGRADAVQRGLLGMDCARRLGLEWSAPDA